MTPPRATTPRTTAQSPASRGKRPGAGGVSWVDDALSVADRVGYVKEAFELGGRKYVVAAVTRRVGEEFDAVVQGLLGGLAAAAGIMVTATAVGAAAGASVGALAGGAGAVPGAAYGARLGLIAGEKMLEWLGVADLLVYVKDHLPRLGSLFGRAVTLAWNSQGTASGIDAAARAFAEAVAEFLAILVTGLVECLGRAAAAGKFPATLAKLRSSKLFKDAGRMEAWLGKHYARLRVRHGALKWEVLWESPERIPNTSIPEKLHIRVGGRTFQLDRNAAKVPKGKTEAIGPATKHLGEAAKDKGSWSKLAELDFPMSSLAGALDQAEAQLLFQAPSASARPVKIAGWELLIDTTQPVWRVYHANYTSTPKW